MSAPNKEPSFPAFPRAGFEASLSNPSQTDTLPQDGMTLQQYAAIKLKVPTSGTPWLDEMIRMSLRNDFAAAAIPTIVHDWCESNAAHYVGATANAYTLADVMLAKMGGKP